MSRPDDLDVVRSVAVPATRVVRPARRAPLDGTPPVVPGLPTAPGPRERYHYLGPQHRVYPLVQGVVSVGVGAVAAAFFGARPQTAFFVVPTLLTLFAALLSTWSTAARRRVELDEHRALVSGWAPPRVPAVDVFLPSAGEPVTLLRNTYEHVARLRWPGGLTVLVLDDSGRPEVERLAAEYGFTYLSRPDRGRMKKAGNLAYGFAHSSGDHVLVLDADFCPTPDMLRELVPYLDDPTVGIVQSPQYFDSRGPRTWLERGAGAVQELFYRWVQPARDGVGAAICVGTNAVYRRSALEASGGFAQIGHSEDVHTGVTLLRNGFGLRYVPVLVARGTCPDGIAGFLAQQYRWCSGSMSLLADRSFHNAGLPLRQRVCYWTGFLYYITTGVNVFTGLGSALVMLWLLPELIAPMQYLPLVVAVWGMFAVWRRVSVVHYDLNVLRVRMLYSVAHALAVWHALTSQTREWVPTGAATRGVPLARQISRLAAGWFTLVEIGIWTGVARGAAADPGRFWLSAVLAVVGSAVLLPVIALTWPETGWPIPLPQPVRRVLARPVQRVLAIGGALAAARRRGSALADVVTWPEALAAAALFGLVLLLSGGLVDVLLPVVGR